MDIYILVWNAINNLHYSLAMELEEKRNGAFLNFLKISRKSSRSWDWPGTRAIFLERELE